MSGDIYISGKSSNNKITISGSGEKKDIDLSTKETNNNLATQNNNAKYYSDKALESANKAEQQANLAKGYAESIVETKNELLNNEDFKTVVTNIDNINTVGENIENVITIAEDLEGVAENLDVINNVNDNLEVITSVNSNLENINAVASNIEDIQNAEENSNIAKEKAQESFNYSELSKHYSEVSKEQADIATSKTNEVVEKGNTAITEIINTKNIAISDIETLADNTKTEIETLGNEKVELATVQAEIAITKASEAIQNASNALKSAENSALSEANAKESENKAKASETNAKISEQNAKSSEQKCQEIYDRLGVVIKLKGRVDSIEDLPTSNVVNGDAYLVGVEGLSSYPEYYWYEDHWEYMGSTEVKLEWGGISGTLSNQTDLQAVLDEKANNNEVVHLVNNETINGVKTFNGKVNFLGNGDSNAVYLSENTRINVHGTTRTVLGFATGTYLIGHSNYDTLIRGKGERPYWGTGSNISTAKTLALTSDIPDISNLATKDEIPKDYATKSELQTKQDALTAGENITIENGVISSTGGSVDLTGYIKNQEVLFDAISIGSANTERATIAIGTDLHVKSEFGVAIARNSYLYGSSNIAIGSGLVTSGGNAIAIGVGDYPYASTSGVNSIAIGTVSKAQGDCSFAIGYWAEAKQRNAIQLGTGTNNTADTLQVWGYPLLNKADGKIYADRLPDVSIPDEYITETELEEALKGVGGGLPIGTIIPVTASASHVPENTLYADGVEFSGAEGQMFRNLWTDYILTEKLDTCSYSEYETELTMTGSCWKWAVDIENQKFRIPFIPDKESERFLVEKKEPTEADPTWYNLYSDGWCEQGGYRAQTVSGSNNKTGLTQDLILPYKDKNYSVIPNANGVADLINITDKETTHFTFSVYERTTNGSYNDKMTWVAFGYTDNVYEDNMRHFVVVATGSINQSEADWSEFASSLASKANIDGSNFNASVKNFDGQWVASELELSSATAIGAYDIDLSSYLPSDGYNYEVLIKGYGIRTSANAAEGFVYSSIIPKSSIPDFRCAANTVNTTNTFVVPIGNDRKIIILIETNAFGTFEVSVVAYRRIGTNQ